MENKMYKTTVAPKGYISGIIVGNIINDELKKSGFEMNGDNYKALFSMVRSQVPKIDNGVTGHGKKNYYHEADVYELVRTVIRGMPEIFEKCDK